MKPQLPDHLRQALEKEAQAQHCSVQDLLASEFSDIPEPTYKRFFDVSTANMMVTDGDRPVKVNKAFLRTLGYDEQTLLSTSFWDFIHPDDMQSTIKTAEKLERNSAIVHFENRYRRVDGEYIWLNWAAVKAAEDGLTYAVARDVTQYKRLESELSQRNDDIMTILESIHDAFFSLDENWHFVYINHEAEHLLQRTSEELLGRSVWEVFPDAVGTTFQEQYRRTMETKQTLTFTEYYPPFETWFEVKSTPAEHGISVFFRNVTQQKQTEEDLERRVAQRTAELEAFINAMPDYIFITERDTTRITYCNDQYAQLVGHDSQNDVIGKALLELFPPHLVEYFTKQNERVFEFGEIFHTVEVVEIRGETYYADTYKIPLRNHHNGEVYALLGTARDLTELHETRGQLATRTRELEEANHRLAESKKFLQSVLDGQSSYIIVIDQTGEIVMANEAWRQSARKNRASRKLVSGVGLNYLEVCERAAADNNQDAQAIGEAIEAVLAGARDEFVYEYSFETPSSERWFEVQITRFVSDNKPHAIISHSNITQRKMVEMKIIEALDQERQLGELKSRFLSMASHEFRTPLAIIQTSTDMLSRYADRLTEDRREAHLQKIHDQIKRLKSMMEDISFVQQSQQRAYRLRPTEINVHLFLKQIAEETQMAFSHQGQIQLVGNTPDVSIPLDTTLMHQIVSNLLSNAIKYSKSENDTIKVNWSYQDHTLKITVTDQGIGISEEDKAYLFEAFHRGDNVGTTQGTGLGLSIVRHAVNAWNGTVQVHSQLDAGTTFIVTLPMEANTVVAN